MFPRLCLFKFVTVRYRVRRYEHSLATHGRAADGSTAKIVTECVVMKRSVLDGREKEIQDLPALHVSKASIAKITGVDRATLAHFLRSRHLG